MKKNQLLDLHDDIDVNIDTDLNFAEIDNKEKKIRIFRRSSSREL